MYPTVLVIDIGNTNMEFGVFVGDSLQHKFRLSTNKAITSDELGLSVTQFFALNGLDRFQVQDIVISSVVPQLNYTVQNMVRKYFDKEALLVGENLPVDIVNRYGNPSEVGADRLVTAVAACHKYGAPLIVVDFGTATTFDVVDCDGAYLGGAIYPGLKISMDALVERTAKLPRVEIEVPETGAIGVSTVTSMQSGIIYGYAGAVSNIVDKLSQQLGAPAKVVGTGGLAKTVGQEYHNFCAIDKTLILDGIKLLYDRHISRQRGC